MVNCWDFFFFQKKKICFFKKVKNTKQSTRKSLFLFVHTIQYSIESNVEIGTKKKRKKEQSQVVVLEHELKKIKNFVAHHESLIYKL